VDRRYLRIPGRRVAHHDGGFGWASVASIVTGLVIGVVFLHKQARMADPLIDLRLFHIPAFSAALAVNILGFCTAFSAVLFIAQFLQSVLGLSPLRAGLWGLPLASAFIGGSLLTPAIVRRFPSAYVIAGGTAVSAAGFVLLALLPGE
jgi:DHA2 family multidrug resistance protein-like MFS transporter